MLLINLFYIISLSLAGSESCFCGGSGLTRTLADNVFGRRCVPCRRSDWLLSMKKRCFYSAYTPNRTAYDMIGDWLLFKFITSAKFIIHLNATDIEILLLLLLLLLLQLLYIQNHQWYHMCHLYYLKQHLVFQDSVCKLFSRAITFRLQCWAPLPQCWKKTPIRTVSVSYLEINEYQTNFLLYFSHWSKFGI